MNTSIHILDKQNQIFKFSKTINLDIIPSKEEKFVFTNSENKPDIYIVVDVLYSETGNHLMLSKLEERTQEQYLKRFESGVL